jgi:hypothetical protein
MAETTGELHANNKHNSRPPRETSHRRCVADIGFVVGIEFEK